MKLVDQAYESCREIIEQHSKSFAKAFSLLPLPKRKAVWAVYAFCRKVDDIVDENGGRVEELDRFQQQFENLLGNATPLYGDMWVALKDVFTRYEMDSKPFLEMIRGQRMDLEKQTYHTLEQVEFYSYHVASTVGLMLLPILAPKQHRDLKEGAIALGIAMQLTNILRDVGEDLEKGRVYLPAEILTEFGYSQEDLVNKRVNKQFISAWEAIASRSEDLYERAYQSIQHYPADAKMPVLASLCFYREILQAVRKNQYQVFDGRAYVTNEQKQQLLYKLTNKEALA